MTQPKPSSANPPSVPAAPQSDTQVRAFRVRGFDTPPALEQVELPPLGPRQIAVRVAACGLNFADHLMCGGTYQDTPALPFTLGMEVAGEVIAMGHEATAFSLGDRVAGFCGQGGLADTVHMDEDRCLTLPDTLDAPEAAAMQIAYGTSHMALDYKARLQPGERLVVTGAAGGVGLTAVEIGKAMGAEVVAIARGARKLAVAKSAGADHLIDADAPDITDQLKALGGVDVTYDAVGGALYDACFRATKPDGRMVLIGFAGGELPALRPNHMLVKNITTIGFYWGGYLSFNPAPLRASLRWLFLKAAAGELKPHISHRLPLHEAGEGLRLLTSREATGKVVVTP